MKVGCTRLRLLPPRVDQRRRRIGQSAVAFGRDAVKDIVGKVWPYVLAGIAVGAGIHGYVPEELMASIMGKGAWWSVPLAVIIGIPMYSNAAGIIPDCPGPAGKGRRSGNGACVHDVGDRPVTARGR